MSTRTLQGQVPWSFLQNSYKIATINANWTVRLISEMERSDFSLHDPFIGYLVTVAATVHLDKSLHKDSDVANSARQKFHKCRDFVAKLATEWPSMANAVRSSLAFHLLYIITPRSYICWTSYDLG